MKKIFVVVLATLFCGSVSAQNGEPTPIVYSAVEKVDGVSAAELFARGRQWFAQAYNNSKVVLQMAEDNRLVGKASFTLKYDAKIRGIYKCKVDYMILVECRDGRYKYTIDNLYLTVLDHGSPRGEYGLLTTAEFLPPASEWATGLNDKHRQTLWKNVKEYSDSYVKALVGLLKVSMNATTSNNDW